MQLYTLTLLVLNIFPKNYQIKSKIKQLLTIYLEYEIMNLLCADFIASLSQNMLAGKALLDCTYLFSPNDYKKNEKRIYKYFKEKYILSLEFRLRKLDKKRNYLLEQMKHNDLMNEKYKNTCKYLNYVEELLILV